MPNGDPVSFPRNGNKRPQDNTQAGKERCPQGTLTLLGAGRGAEGCSPLRDKMAPAKPLQRGWGWEHRQKSDTQRNGHTQPPALGHCHAWLRPGLGSPCARGLAAVSFGKKRWDERTVADESWDLPAKSHPALETILKSKGQQAQRVDIAPLASPQRRRPWGPSPAALPAGAPRSLLPSPFH